jgi:hypothetical protein
MNEAIKQQAEGEELTLSYPPVTVRIECGDNRAAVRFAKLIHFILSNSSTGIGDGVVVSGTLDQSTDDFIERLDRVEAENRFAKIEREHIIERLVVSEAITAKLTTMLYELDAKRLAALVLAGELDANHFEERRNKSRFELRDTLQIYRDRAQSSTNNRADR